MTRSNGVSTPLGYLIALYRHKFKALSAFVFVAGLAVIAAFFLPKTYRSEGVFFVRLGRDNAVLDSTAIPGQKPIVALPSSRESEINSLVEVLDSRVIMEKVVDALGPNAILKPATLTVLYAAAPTAVAARSDLQTGAQILVAKQGDAASDSAVVRAAAADRSTAATVPGKTDLKQRDDAIRKLSQCVSTEPALRSTVIRIICNGPSPVWCQAVVSKIIDVFVAEHIQLTRSPGSLQFFSDQTARLRRDLDQKEDQLCELMTKTGIASPDEQRKALVLRTSELQDALSEAERDLTVGQAQVEKLESQLHELPEEEVASLVDGRTDPGTDLMRDELYRLQLLKEEASARYTKEHPLMKNVEQQLAEAVHIMDKETPTRTETTKAKNHLYEETKLALLKQQAAIASSKAKTDMLKQQLADAQRELNSFNAQELSIRRLQRDVDIVRADYQTYAASVERSRVDQALDAQQMSSISVAQPATLEIHPISPRKTIILALGLITALLSAFGIVLIAELVTTSDDLACSA